MTEPTLRVHQLLPHSQANGPGTRAVIWVQGCSLGCPGCFNPQSHPPTGGQDMTITELFAWLVGLGETIQGLTLSGGEPLQQIRPLVSLLTQVRQRTRLSSLVFSGYTWEEIQRMPQASALCAQIDVLISGRYHAEQRLARDLRGSANKQVHLFSNRYQLSDLIDIPPAEIIIGANGEVLLSGIDPLIW